MNATRVSAFEDTRNRQRLGAIGAAVKILVTGASGFIGSHLVARLGARHEVFAVARSSHNIAPAENVACIAMDLARRLDEQKLPAQIDVIIHLAQANVPFPEGASELLVVNTGAAQQLLDYGYRAGAQQFILASTGDVYGRRSGRCKESDAVAPETFYAVTKYSAEMVTKAYSNYLRGCVLRLFHPYGPGQLGRLIPKLAERIRQEKAIRLNQGDGPHTSPVWIDDVSCAIERAIDGSASGVLNIAGDRNVSMRELAEEIGRALEREPAFEVTDEEPFDLMGDNELMKRVLGEWNLVTLTDGLSNTFRGEEDTKWRVHG